MRKRRRRRRGYWIYCRRRRTPWPFFLFRFCFNFYSFQGLLVKKRVCLKVSKSFVKMSERVVLLQKRREGERISHHFLNYYYYLL